MLRLLFTGIRYFKLKILLADLFLLHACRAVYANSILCRNAVAEAMVWCIEAAESVEEIVDCIAESLSLLEVRKCVRNIVSCEKKYVKIYTENTETSVSSLLQQQQQLVDYEQIKKMRMMLWQHPNLRPLIWFRPQSLKR